MSGERMQHWVFGPLVLPNGQRVEFDVYSQSPESARRLINRHVGLVVVARGGMGPGRSVWGAQAGLRKRVQDASGQWQVWQEIEISERAKEERVYASNSHLSVRLSKEHIDQLAALSNRNGVSKTAMLVRLIEQEWQSPRLASPSRTTSSPGSHPIE